ncbi:MAG: cupin domain-containing protein [Marmoricola sp.]
MVERGDTIENPVTGERMTWVRTSAETGGALAVIDLDLSPSAFLAAEHVHRSQEERFEVLEGRILLSSSGKQSVRGPGEVVVVPPGSPHSWAPQDGTGARVRLTFTPGAFIEDFFEEFFRCAREGRTDERGVPSSPFVMARLCTTHDLYGAQLPVPLQRAAFRLLVTAARALPAQRR